MIIETVAKQQTRSSKHDAIALLLEDHKKVQKLFEEWASNSEKVDEARRWLTARAYAWFTPHIDQSKQITLWRDL